MAVKETMKQPKFIIRLGGKVITRQQDSEPEHDDHDLSSSSSEVSNGELHSSYGSATTETTEIKTSAEGCASKSEVSKRKIHESYEECGSIKTTRIDTNRNDYYNSRLEDSKRKLHEGYEAADRAKKERRIEVIGRQTQLHKSTDKEKICSAGSRFKTSAKDCTSISEVSKRKTNDYESKLEASKRKLQQGYEAADRAKKERRIEVIGRQPLLNKSADKEKRCCAGSRFKTKKLQRLYDNTRKTRSLF